jgi:hypothetical protein
VARGREADPAPTAGDQRRRAGQHQLCHVSPLESVERVGRSP